MKTLNKKKQTSVIRNVLASPYEKFWPLLNVDNTEVLSALLLKVLPSAAILKSVLSQKKLKQIYREKDAEKRKRLWQQKENTNQQSKEQVEKARLCRKSLMMGVNCVTRGLEKSDVAACLISGDVTPRLLVEHIIQSAARSGVTVLVVTSLKKVTLSALAFPCLALALHKCVAEDKDNTFHELYELILKLGKGFNVPEHLNVLQNSVNEAHSTQTDSTSHDSAIVTPPIIKIESKSNCQSTFQYLQRLSVNQRVFIPPKPDMRSDSDNLTFIPISKQEDINHMSFKRINISDSLDEESDNCNVDISVDSGILKEKVSVDIQNTYKISKKRNLKFISFKPTTVKRIKSNPNKKKRKAS